LGQEQGWGKRPSGSVQKEDTFMNILDLRSKQKKKWGKVYGETAKKKNQKSQKRKTAKEKPPINGPKEGEKPGVPGKKIKGGPT